MYLLLLGVLLLALKLLAVAGVGDWPWWLVLSPFAAAVLWWQWADWSGYTKRREIEKMEALKQERLKRQRDALKSGPTLRK